MEVTKALIDYAKAQKIAACVIECSPKQEASAHIARKNHFRYMGKNDGCDVYRLDLYAYK